MRWIPATERLGEFKDSEIPHWKFFNCDFAKVDGRAVELPFFRKDTEKGTITFSYKGVFDNKEISESEFHRIVWLDEQDEGWVPVGEELPDKLRPVLIYERGPNVNDYTIAVSFWDGTYSKDKRKMPQFPDGQDEQPGYYWPSHWRPLPGPPATT